MLYYNLFFAQGGQAAEYLDDISNNGEEVALKRLINDYAYDDDAEPLIDVPWGKVDRTFVSFDGHDESKHHPTTYYVLSYLYGLQYVGLTMCVHNETKRISLMRSSWDDQLPSHVIGESGASRFYTTSDFHLLCAACASRRPMDQTPVVDSEIRALGDALDCSCCGREIK